MKNQTKITLTVIATFALALMTGCGTIDSLYDRQVTSVPGDIIGTNTLYETNSVLVESAKTNEITGEVTPPMFEQAVTPVTTYDYAPPTYVTNLVPKPAVAGAIVSAGAFPLPFAGTAGLALGFLYSAYAAVRNRKTAKALVLGIEAGRRFLNETPEGQKLDTVLRDKLIEHQEIAGVLNEVGQLVNAYTGNTVTSEK